MKVRKGQDNGVFFVESSSKLETQEHSVDLFEMVCTCTDFTARCYPRKKINPTLVLHPSKERTACKHISAALIYLGHITAKKWKEQVNKQQT
jgi:hypothetical protein